jgi:hypothetical protein
MDNLGLKHVHRGGQGATIFLGNILIYIHKTRNINSEYTIVTFGQS